MLLNHYIEQIDLYSFKVKDYTSAQTYQDAGITDFSVTTAKIVVTNTMTGKEYEVDILTDWDHIFECGGLTINMLDFQDMKMDAYDYFPDGVYKTRIEYTYAGIKYTDSSGKGFTGKIFGVVTGQVLASNWRKELHCDCNCKNPSSTIRKFDYLQSLTMASDHCLYDEFMTILRALYKLTEVNYEYSV